MTSFKIIREKQSIDVHCEGRNVFSAPIGQCASAVDFALSEMGDNPGKIQFGAGRFDLDRPILVDKQVTIEGTGYGTCLVPAAGTYAVEVKANANTPLRREIIRDADPWLREMENRTHGISLRNLRIDGFNQGKGLSVEFLIEGDFSNLYIYRVVDGPAIRLGPSVMETTFTKIHLLDCGALNSAAISIERQEEGDACNNLIFDKVFVIFPNGTGMEIGSGLGEERPRIITLHDCMFHGWLPIERAADRPLLKIKAIDRSRGARIQGGRFTNAGFGHPLVAIHEGDAKFNMALFGGGGGSCAIMSKPGTSLSVRDSIFHSLRGRERHGDLVHAGGVLNFDGNVCHKNFGRIVLNQKAAALICGNTFYAEGRGGRVFVVNPGAQARIRDNIFVEFPEGMRNDLIGDNLFT
ncbi:hypothetical protein [Nitratireductor sp. XY-223]|uniref:hypothetical protein n=1 Tax=Nitratireductor sp. XY-223 TaxID=2561926 RepID=UPI0010AABBAD|nr:hypothetical protein [Nitratireductor sp. XY-223]